MDWQQTFRSVKTYSISHSEFLKRASKEEWICDTTRTVSLAEDEPKAFQMYAALTHTGFLASKGLPYERQSLVDVYVLAESLVDTWAKTCIINVMHSFIVHHSPKTILTVEDIRAFASYFT